MDSFFKYTCNNGLNDYAVCCETTGPDNVDGWVWFSHNEEGKLEVTEVGPMPYYLLESMVKFLTDDRGGDESFLTDAEQELLKGGSELLLLAAYERGDSSVGIPDGYEMDTAPGISRKMEAPLEEEYEVELTGEALDAEIDRSLRASYDSEYEDLEGNPK